MGGWGTGEAANTFYKAEYLKMVFPPLKSEFKVQRFSKTCDIPTNSNTKQNKIKTMQNSTAPGVNPE